MELLEWLAEWETVYEQIENLIIEEIDGAPRDFRLAVKKIDIELKIYLKIQKKRALASTRL